MKYIVTIPFLIFAIIPWQSFAYESTYTRKVISASIVFYEDNDIVCGMAVFKNKNGDYVSIINAGATVTMVFYCKEISPFTNRPDTNTYREERDITVKSRYFQEITLSNGDVIFGLPIFRYDGVPWFSHDMNWYKLDPDFFYDKKRICKKVSLHFNCRGIDTERVVNLYKKDRNLRKRIKYNEEIMEFRYLRYHQQTPRR